MEYWNCCTHTCCCIKDIAERLGLNYSSLRKYMYKHHPEVLEARRNRENKSDNDHDEE